VNPWNRFDVRETGRLVPGNRGVGTLSVTVGGNGFRMYTQSIYEWELGASGNDRVDVTGNLELRSGWTLKLQSAGGTPRITDEYDIFTYTGSFNGSYNVPIIDTSEMPEEWVTSSMVVVHDSANKRVYVTGLFTTLAIANADATDLTSTSAQLNSRLSCSGLVMDVWAYWGGIDEGSDAGSWSNSAHVGTYTDKMDFAIGHVAPNLDTNVQYYFTFRATNATKDIWAAPSKSFTALGPPIVDNDGGATHILAGQATLQGSFNDHNRGNVILCWGLTDAGTGSILDWDHATAIGLKTNETFSGVIDDAFYPLTYYYRCYASNAYGEGWAPTASSFTMTVKPWGRPDAPSGAMAYWSFDDSFDVGHDDSGNGHEGTQIGDASYSASGKFKGALDLDGNGDFLNCGDGIDIDNHDFSLSFWTKRDGTGEDYAIGHTDSGGNNNQLHVGFRNGTRFTFAFWGNDMQYDNGGVCGDLVNYHHWVCTFDATTRQQLLYLDGNTSPVDNETRNNVFLGTGDFYIGTRLGDPAVNPCYDGRLDEVYVYDRVLSASEAAQLYSATTQVDIITIDNNQSTERTLNTAKLNATVSVPDAVYDVWAHWGTVDGGTDRYSWASNAHIGTYTNVIDLDVSHVIGSLGAASTPFYTFRLTNAVGDSVWATPSTNVLAVTAPAIDNDGGAVAGVGTATLRGNLTAGTVADVYVYWGRSDGGTTKGNWDNYALLNDTPEGAFQTDVAAGYGYTYYYRCYATNPITDAWAIATTNFTTVNPVITNYTYNALRYAYYGGAAQNEIADIDDGVANGQNGGLFDLTPTPEASWPGAVQGKSTWTTEVQGPGMADNYCQMWWGHFHPPSTGIYTFYLRGDDYEIFWVDYNLNGGEYEAGSDDFIRNYPPEGWNVWHDNETIELTNGVVYPIALACREGGGGDWVDIKITAPTDSRREVNPGDVNQDGWWSLPEYTVDEPSLTNNSESGVSTNLATLNGTLSSTGWVYHVWLHWGGVDGGMVPGNWSNSVDLGYVTNHEGSISHEITGLTELTSYFYTFQATNPVRTLWADPSEPFQTLGTVIMTNLTAGTLTPTTAVLRAEMLSGGSGDATIYWGTVDQGESHSGWDHTSDFGTVVVGPFSTQVTVVAGQTYYYRAYATNEVSEDWGLPVRSFSVPSPAVTLAMTTEREDLGFDPTSISGCALWLDANDTSTLWQNVVGTIPVGDGDPVVRWDDKSGNDRDAQREGADNPQYNAGGPNGRGVVTFSGDYMSTAYNFDPLVDYTILTVSRYSGGDNERVISSATRNWLFGYHSNGDEKWHPSTWIINQGYANTDWHVHAGHMNSDADPKASFWKDGARLLTDNTSSGANNYMIGRLGLGGYRNNNEESNCEIAEVLIYNRVLTDAEVDQVGLYLGWKYGIDTEHADAHPVPVTETRGSFNVTATLSTPCASNVTVNFDFGSNTHAYAQGIRASVFLTNINNDTAINIDGSSYAVSDSRVFTGNKPDTILAMTEEYQHNTVAQSEILHYYNFPLFNGNADYFATAFSGTIIPRASGSHTFRGQCDDTGWMYIDVNGDGLFANSERVFTGNNSGAKTLTADEPYNFIFMHREGTAGNNMQWWVTEPGGTEERVNPSLQAGLWNYPLERATFGNDYTSTAVSITIPAGVLSSNITLTVLDDTVQENDEAFDISIGSLVNATSGIPTRVGGAISSADPMVTTGVGPTDITAFDATLNGELEMGDAADVTIYWGTSDGGTDHTAWGATITVGETSEDVPFSRGISGMKAGGIYSYRCYATNGSNLAEDWSDLASITTTPAAVSIADVSAIEGDSGSVDAVFAITADAESLGDVTFSYVMSNGTATAGADYTAASGSLTIPAGSTATQITVQVTGDTTFENPDETFTVHLYNPGNCTIADGAATGTIRDDDAEGHLDEWRSRMQITLEPYVEGLRYAWFNDVASSNLKAIDDGVANGENGGLFALTPTAEGSWPTQVRGKSIWTGEVWQGGNISDTYAQMWWGVFRAPETGSYEFYVHGDDNEVLWIDVNQNGEFEDPGDLITDNAPPEGWDNPKTETVSLTAGEFYAFALAHHEGGGGDFVNIEIKIPSAGSRVRINPSDAAQDGWWLVPVPSADIMSFDRSALTNFPAVVRFDTSIPGFEYTQFYSDTGGDLRIANADITRMLNFEIERWDTGGESTVWVQVPEITGTNTTFWAYWGHPYETNLPAYATDGSAWTEDFAAVYHLSSNADDSSPNDNDGAHNGDPAPTTESVIGQAYAFDGNDRVRAPDHASLDLTEALTIGGWVRPTAWNQWSGVISKGSDNAYEIEQSNNGGTFRMRLNNQQGEAPDHTVSQNTWVYMVGTYDRQYARLYINGVDVDSRALTVALNQNGNELSLGDRSNNDYFTGQLDEMRVSSVARSRDWIEYCYLNQGTSHSVASFGAVEGKPHIDIVTGAENLTYASADLTATVSSTGTAESVVWAFWGDDDAGRVAGNWDSNQYFGVCAGVPSNYVKHVTNLADSTQYYYTYMASNVWGATWAPTNFYTYGRPAVTNTGADTYLGYAILNGNVISTGGAPTTVYTYWGDNDGGTTPALWDYRITNGILQQGPFSASTPTNLYYGVTYYYRTFVENTHGDRWAAESTSFGTPSPHVDPALTVTNGLLTRWIADDIAGVSEGERVDAWENSFNPGTYDLTRMGGNPTYDAVVPGLNDHAAVVFTTDGNDWFEFDDITTIRTVFWVLRDARVNGNEQFLLGDDGAYHFHNGGWRIWNGNAHANIRNGTTELNGTVVNGQNTDRPSDFGIISVRTTGNVQASRVSRDRSIDNRSWEGEMAEILIYNTQLSGADEDEVGGYLAWKYGLSTAYSYTMPPQLGIANTHATNVNFATADLQGTLEGTGSVFDVYVYWGTTNGGTDAGAWATNEYVGRYTNALSQDISHGVGSLAEYTTYYYTFHATNDATSMWASPSASFKTRSAFEWDGDTDDLWGTPGNWVGNNVPDAPGEYAVFPAGAGGGPVDINGTGYTIDSLDIKGGDYVFTNSGAAATVTAGTLTQTAGSNQVFVGVSVTGTVEVAAGTLVIDDISTFNSGDVTLSGGSLVIDGDAAVLQQTASNSLEHRGYNGHNNDTYLDLNSNGGLMTLVPSGAGMLTDGPDGRGLNFDDDRDFTSTGIVLDPNNDQWEDNYANLFIGTFTPPETGTFGFRRADDDDRAGIWLDLDRDGVFESTTAGLGSNRGEQLSWEDGGNKSVSLTAGLAYMIAFVHREGGGGSRCDFRFTTPSLTEQLIKPSDPEQAGMWGTIDYQVDATGLGAITVTADSTLHVASLGGGARFGAVGLSGGTLTLSAYLNRAEHRFTSMNGSGSLDVTDDGEITLDNVSSLATLTAQDGSITGATITAATHLDLEKDYTIHNNLAGAATVTVGDDDAQDGLVVLSGNNTYSGETTIGRGVLRASNPSPNSRVIFSQNNRDQTCILESNGTFSRDIGQDAGEIWWENIGGGGGFAAHGGDLTVNLNGGFPVVWNSTANGLNNVDSLQFGSRTADGMVEFANGIILDGSTRRVQVIDNTRTKADVIRLSGNITDGNANAWLRFHESSGNQFNQVNNLGDTLVELTGNNTYLHRTLIQECTLYAVEGTGLPVNSYVRFQANNEWDRPAVLMSSGTLTRNIGENPGQVYWQNGGGFAARGGTLTVVLEGGAQIDWDDANTGVRERPFHLNSAHADSLVDFQNDIRIDGTDWAFFMVWDNTDTDQDIAKLSGVISDGSSGGLRKRKDGTLWLTGNNTYTRDTFLDNGVIRAIDGTGLPTTSQLYFEGDNNDAPVVFESSGTFTRNIQNADGNNVYWQERGGFSAYGGKLTVNLEGGIELNAGDANTGFRGRNLHLGSHSADSEVDLANNILLNNHGQWIFAWDNPHSDTDRTVISGNIRQSGWGDIYVGGDGWLELTGATTNRNGRSFHNATLCFNGYHRLTDQIFTEGGMKAAMGGTGTVDVQNRFDIRELGRLAPGVDGVGTLDVTVAGGNGFRMYNSSTYEWELGASGHDRVDVTAPNLELRNGWKLKILSRNGTPLSGDEYTIFTYSGTCPYYAPVIDMSEAPDDWAGVTVVHDTINKRIYITGLHSTLSMGNEAPSNLTDTTAQFNGLLSCSGKVMQVWAYWGGIDGGTNASSWSNSAYVATYTNVIGQAVSYPASGLTGNTGYYCTLRATNATTDLWGEPSRSFTTLGPPIVDNDGGADHITAYGTAMLQGSFNDHNRGDVTLCWGLSDAGTGAIGDWDHATSIGSQTNAAFWGIISGARYPLTYYYRCYATNDYGEDWAPSASSFTMNIKPRGVPNSPTGAIGYWSFDDPSNVGYDDSHNGHNGTQIGDAAHYGSGKVGGALTCDGTGDFLNCGDRIEIDNRDFSLSFWTKRDATGEDYVIGHSAGQGANNTLHVGFRNATRFTFAFWANDLQYDNNPVVSDTVNFHHWVCMYDADSNQQLVYLDGNESPVQTRTSTLDFGGTLDFYIGTRNNDSHPNPSFDGLIDEVYVYDRTLAGSEAAELYDAGTSYEIIGVVNGQPTERRLNTCKLNGIISTSNAVYDVWLYHGLTDGGTDPNAWDTSVFMGTLTNVMSNTVSYVLGGLDETSTNFYTFQITNALDFMWATPSTNISQITQPHVTNAPGPLTVRGSATLRGTLTEGSVADIYVYWGHSDGGTDPNAWDGYELLSDTLQGTFSREISAGHGLTYYYRCYATNVVGHHWATYTTNFSLPHPANYYPAGLIAGSRSGNIWTGNPNPGNLGVVMHPQCQRREVALKDAHWRANRSDTGDPGPNNTTIIYTGQIYMDGNTYTFAEMCDDRTRLLIDGQQLINDGSWNNGVSAQFTRSAGWYDIDLRFSNGGGGYGFSGQQNTGQGDSNWNNVQYGFGMTNTAVTGENAYDYVYPEDPGDATLFRHYDPTGGALPVYATNSAVSGLTTTSGTFNATVQCTGWVFNVYAYYGETDGGTDPGAWDTNQFVGAYANLLGDTVSTFVTGLVSETDYHYTFLITNDVTNVWASPSTNFTTLGYLAVSNEAPTLVAQTSATLNGEIAAGGSGDATIFWGLSNGGATISAWSNAASFGNVITPVSLSTNITGLLAGQRYYYRTYATNVLGDDWAPQTYIFTTDVAQVSVDDVVVTEGDSGTVNATFTISLSATSGPSVYVDYNTVAGSALPGDYTPRSGQLSFPSGTTSRQVAVTVHGDTIGEYPSEAFTLQLSAPIRCTIADASGTCTITDDDLAESFGNWEHWMKITFDGYAGTETLQNFPALITLGEHLDGFLYSSFYDADGGDLRFADANKTQMLDYEIDVWGHVTTCDGNQDIYSGGSVQTGGIHAAHDSIRVAGSGSDIWGTADRFHYAYRQVTGDFDVSCRVVSIDGRTTDQWTRGGIMARNSLNASSRNAMAYWRPVANRLDFNRRTSDGGGTGRDNGPVKTLPVWMRLTRSGDVFRTYSSDDGSSWSQVGANVTIGMDATIYLGLGVSSHNNGQTTTYEFDNLSGVFTNRATDPSKIWVKVPQLNSSTYIWAYWGEQNLSAPASQTNGAVWSQDYAAVYHLSDMTDSTANRNDGVANNDPDLCPSESRVGQAYHFDGNDRIRAADDASLDLVNGITLCGWFRSQTWNQWSGIISKGSDNAYELECNAGSQMRIRINNQGGQAATATGLNLHEWYHIAGTYDRAWVRMYINGNQVDARSLSLPINANNSELSLGDRSNNDYFTGQLDEMRVSSVARSADWVKARYDNEGPGSTFATYDRAVWKPRASVFLLR